MKINFSVLLLLICSLSFSQHELLKELTLEDQVQGSEVIVEGQVIEKKSYWDKGRKNIYTVHTIAVSTSYKGDANPYLYVVSLGGVVGVKALIVKPSLNVSTNSAGVFLTKSTSISLVGFDPTKKLYQTIGASQGFYKYDRINTLATNPFQSLRPTALDNRLRGILKTTPKQLRAVEYFTIESKKETQIQSNIEESPVIHTVEPLEIVAGNRSTLTITGVGFGDTLGLVLFKNADDGGHTYFEALQTQIVRWTNTEIIVEVPTNAGTGSVLVIHGESFDLAETPSITITYAYINLLYSDTEYQVQNGALVEYIIHHIGGFDPLPEKSAGNFSDGNYVFTYNEEFIENAPAVSSFESGFDQIVCNSGIRFEIDDQTTTPNKQEADSLNVISFSSLPRGVLGQTSIYTLPVYLDPTIIIKDDEPNDTMYADMFWYTPEIDFALSDQIDWDFDLDGETASTEFDFNAVIRHEIGHAAGLGHVINNKEIMHFSLSQGPHQDLLSDPIYNPVRDKIKLDREKFLAENHEIIPPNYSECYILGDDNYNPLLSLVEIYPNPTYDYLFISVQQTLQNIDMYAVNGEKVTANIEIKEVSSFDRKLNLSSLSPGTYFLVLQIDNKIHTQQIVKNGVQIN